MDNRWRALCTIDTQKPGKLYKLHFAFPEENFADAPFQSGKILRKVLRDNAKAEQQQISAKL